MTNKQLLLQKLMAVVIGLLFCVLMLLYAGQKPLVNREPVMYKSTLNKGWFLNGAQENKKD